MKKRGRKKVLAEKSTVISFRVQPVIKRKLIEKFGSILNMKLYLSSLTEEGDILGNIYRAGQKSVLDTCPICGCNEFLCGHNKKG